jgi:hypothetical protein
MSVIYFIHSLIESWISKHSTHLNHQSWLSSQRRSHYANEVFLLVERQVCIDKYLYHRVSILSGILSAI